jgi:hypothetical protein
MRTTAHAFISYGIDIAITYYDKHPGLLDDIMIAGFAD